MTQSDNLVIGGDSSCQDRLVQEWVRLQHLLINSEEYQITTAKLDIKTWHQNLASKLGINIRYKHENEVISTLNLDSVIKFHHQSRKP